MTKSELLEELIQRLPKVPPEDVEQIVNLIFGDMSAHLARRERVEIRGFGSFVARHRRAREGRNPKSGRKVSVPDKWVPFFTPGKDLRERVNKIAAPLPEKPEKPEKLDKADKTEKADQADRTDQNHIKTIKAANDAQTIRLDASETATDTGIAADS